MLNASQYHSVVIDRFPYEGFHRCQAWCALEILRASDGRMVVIATELEDNPGTSITNVCEQLAYRACVDFAIDPSKLVWIEHYGYPSPSGSRRPRTYDLVSFTILPPGHDAVFVHPTWRPMREEDWHKLGLPSREPGP